MAIPDDWTLVRSLHHFDWWVDAGGGESFQLFVAAGVLAWDWPDASDVDRIPQVVPDGTVPFDGDRDWIWKWVWPLTARDLTIGSAFPVYSSDGNNLLVESKAQRKLSAGTGLLLVVQLFQPAELGAVNFGWQYAGRYGFKLP